MQARGVEHTLRPWLVRTLARGDGPSGQRMGVGAHLCSRGRWPRRQHTTTAVQVPRRTQLVQYQAMQLAQTRAALRPVKRRYTVGADGPNTGGSRCQVQPVVTTKVIAARTARSPYRRQPPPCGQVGADGTTRPSNSHSYSPRTTRCLARGPGPAPQSSAPTMSIHVSPVAGDRRSCTR